MEANKQDVIRQLVEMDKHARTMVEDAQSQRRRAELELAQTQAKLEKDIIERAQTRIQKIKSETTNEAERRRQEIETEGKRAMQQLIESYEASHQKWEDALFARCTEPM